MRNTSWLLIMLLMFGCSAQISYVKEGDNYAIFQLSEDAIFSIVQTEMYNFTDSVGEMEGSEKGYKTTFVFLLDRFNVWVKILPVAGPTLEGKEAKGFYVQLDGGGSYASQQPQKMMDAIQKRLEETNTKILVTSIRRIPYESDAKVVTLQPPSPIDQLRQLKSLYDDGIITDDEYEQKKGELLDKIK